MKLRKFDGIAFTRVWHGQDEVTAMITLDGLKKRGVKVRKTFENGKWCVFAKQLDIKNKTILRGN